MVIRSAYDRALRRDLASWLVVVASGWLAAACGGSTGSAASGLEVERTTEDTTAVVRNLAGSTWGAPAQLVEELSIGVLEGAEEYMFGRIAGIWVDGDRLYAVDGQVPAARIYDLDGAYLGDLGRKGEGPGEYTRPSGVAVLADGTVVVRDGGTRRLLFFDAGGTPVRAWSAESGFLAGVHELDDGTLLVRLNMPPANAGRVYIGEDMVAPLHDDGTLGEMRPVPTLGFQEKELIVETGGAVSMMSGSFLYFPYRSWGVRSDGAIVVGVSDRYRFEIHHADGAVTAVEKYWDPVPIDPAEAAYAVAGVEGQFRQLDPQYTYNGDPVPATKPAFGNLTVDHDDRVWALRYDKSVREEDCVEDPRADAAGAARRPCWTQTWVLDAFAPDGTYLGELRRPEGLSFRSVFVDGDSYWAAVEDEDGLVTVRRFRIVVGPTS